MKERREYSRMDFSAAVTYEVSESLAAEMAEQHKGEGMAVDASEGGICFVTQDAIKKGHIIKLNLPLSGLPIQTPTLAKVRWVKPYNKRYKVGMSFVI